MREEPDELVWVGGMSRDTADMLFTIVVKVAVTNERTRLARLIRDAMTKDDAATGHAKAKGRAYRAVLAWLDQHDPD